MAGSKKKKKKNAYCMYPRTKNKFHSISSVSPADSVKTEQRIEFPKKRVGQLVMLDYTQYCWKLHPSGKLRPSGEAGY